MEEAHSKDDLPPVPAERVLLKEVIGDLGEGSPDVGSQTFGRFVRHLVPHYTAEPSSQKNQYLETHMSNSQFYFLTTS